MIARVRGLEFYYPARRSFRIQVPHFDLQEGERLFLHGPSGSGKTTFLELLAGILSPVAGSVEICGQDLATLTEGERDLFRGQSIGFIFQTFNLIPYLSLQENLFLPWHIRGALSESDRVPLVEKSLQLCERFEMTRYLDFPVNELSQGQQQRVALMRVLLSDARLIIADEPTSALDGKQRDEFLRLLFEYVKESSRALVFVSHDRSLETQFDRAQAFAEINSGSVE